MSISKINAYIFNRTLLGGFYLDDFNKQIERYRKEMLDMISRQQSSELPQPTKDQSAPTAPTPPPVPFTPPVIPDEQPEDDVPVEMPTPVDTPEILPPNVKPGKNIVMTAIGKLQVKTVTALDALPVMDAVVVISSTNDDNRELVKVLRTDSSGKTDAIELYTLPQQLSEVPGNRTPFATYDIEVTKPGFIPIVSKDVPVFENATTLQTFEMIALPEFETAPEESVIENTEPDL